MEKANLESWLLKGPASAQRLITAKRKVAKSIVRVHNSQAEVLFPYPQPYECQIKMIEAVTQCVENGQNGLIESPTGTGKTLSILCGAIAALQKSRLEYRSD